MQPGQHLYLRESLIEIETLSPARSLPALCTGRTLRVVVPARLAPWFLDEVEDRELFSVGIGIARRQFDRGWFAKKFVRDGHAQAEPRQLGFGELLQVLEVGEL